MTYRVQLERDYCIGAGMCEMIAPEVFVIDRENRVTLADPEAPARVPESLLMEAAQSCPVAAIRLYDESGEMAYPSYE